MKTTYLFSPAYQPTFMIYKFENEKVYYNFYNSTGEWFQAHGPSEGYLRLEGYYEVSEEEALNKIALLVL